MTLNETKIFTIPIYNESSQECFWCKKNSLIFDNELGEIVCISCGHVILERIQSRETDRKEFSDDGTDRRRTGDSLSISRHDMGLSTVINNSNKDALGKKIPTSIKNTVQRLRLWDKKIIYSSDRTLMTGFTQLAKTKEKLGLSAGIMEKASYTYRKAVEKELTRGRTINALAAASLYLACRYSETPHTINDIVNATNIRKKEISKCYRLLLREFDYVVPLQDPIRCVNRVANNLGISERTKRSAIKIIGKAIQGRITAGKDPMSLAAAALYLSCLEKNEFYSQKDIALTSKVTEVTIRNRIKTLKAFLGN
jgi:transcription initiation factor TFIIB